MRSFRIDEFRLAGRGGDGLRPWPDKDGAWSAHGGPVAAKAAADLDADCGGGGGRPQALRR